MLPKLEIRNLHRAALFVLLVGATAAAPFVRSAFGTTVVTAAAPIAKPRPGTGDRGRLRARYDRLDVGPDRGRRSARSGRSPTRCRGNSPGVPIRVGLVAYRDRGDEYVTRRVDLTEDLDAVWAQLRELRADGGGDTPESVNEALHEAVTKLSWSSGPNVYRVVFLVGDAPPHLDYPQDVSFRQSAGLAAQKDIVINTVQCGAMPETTPVWQEIAKLGLGQFAAIGQDGAMVAVAAPQDDELSVLNRKLAATVIPYGDAAAQAEVKNKVAASLAAPARGRRRAPQLPREARRAREPGPRGPGRRGRVGQRRGEGRARGRAPRAAPEARRRRAPEVRRGQARGAPPDPGATSRSSAPSATSSSATPRRRSRATASTRACARR